MLPADMNSLSSKAPAASSNSRFVGRQQSLPRSPNGPVARIEDTLEELDRLEDEFEAVHRMVRISRVATPDKKVYDECLTDDAKRPVVANDTCVVRPAELAKTVSARKSTGSADPAERSSVIKVSVVSPSTKRISEARPRSLLPPKPSVKSSKPPTVSTFELPGEAISRRKREEHEAKIKQQLEEERKRREFKARPIRQGNTPNAAPRETLTSRARTNRASIYSEGAPARITLGVPNSASQANRRQSAVSSESEYDIKQVQMPRGRGTSLGRSPTVTRHISRTSSTPASSASGKQSTPLQEVQNQKLRGREILQRDGILSSQRDREKKEREALAKQARQQAAERSRALSREWAEKQKLKGKMTATA
ncbi:hypothetical protein SEPCBS119000_004036 [Sporothrix epigloea]|uniref:Carboxylesterase family protein n=1 Tax=Sporothrix epigloea TaxID=1892477 RepID=A0ABP0DR69_9PEZI